MIIAFDVDGTLIDINDNPREAVIETLKMVGQWEGITVIVWSGGGKDYASMWVRRLGLESYVDEIMMKNMEYQPDLVFDDEYVKLGKTNIKV